MSNTIRQRRRKRERRALQVLAAVALLVGGAYLWRSGLPAFGRYTRRTVAARRTAVRVARTVKLAPATPSRPVYPYSIIRGGAYSGAELAAALDRDAVAAVHYAVFRRNAVHTTSSPFTGPVYLSYRVGNAVYWTSRPVQLPPGETLLSDGRNYARARCGNRISEKPEMPVNETEPEPAALDTPQPVRGSLAAVDTWSDNRLASEMELLSATLPVERVPVSAVPTMVATMGPTPSWWLVTPFGGILLTGGTGTISGYTPPPVVPPVTPLVEPNPIPGLVLPPIATNSPPLTTPGLIPTTPGSVPTGPTTPGTPIISIDVIPPGVNPPAPTSPIGPWYPVIPVNPTTPTIPLIPLVPGLPTFPVIPGLPIEVTSPVPEPGLWPVLVLAAAAGVWLRRRP